MTAGYPRKLSESELDDDGVQAAEAEALSAGDRSYRHWRDRGEPPAPSSALAMRQACPYDRDDSRTAVFFHGWMLASRPRFEHQVAAGAACPRLSGSRCWVLRTIATKSDIALESGERMNVPKMWIRRLSA